MDDGHGARSNKVNQLTENGAIGQGLSQIFWQGNLQLRLQSLQHRQSIKDVFILVSIRVLEAPSVDRCEQLMLLRNKQ